MAASHIFHVNIPHIVFLIKRGDRGKVTMPCIVLGRLELDFVMVSPSVRGGVGRVCVLCFMFCVADWGGVRAFWEVRAAPGGGVACDCVNVT